MQAWCHCHLSQEKNARNYRSHWILCLGLLASNNYIIEPWNRRTSRSFLNVCVSAITYRISKACYAENLFWRLSTDLYFETAPTYRFLNSANSYLKHVRVGAVFIYLCNKVCLKQGLDSLDPELAADGVLMFSVSASAVCVSPDHGRSSRLIGSTSHVTFVVAICHC